MSQPNPKWLKEIQSLIDSVAYGTVAVEPILIERDHSKTTALQTTVTETIRYETSEKALQNIIDFLVALIEQGFNGDEHIRIHFKNNGKIELVGFTSVKYINYSAKTKKKDKKWTKTTPEQL